MMARPAAPAGATRCAAAWLGKRSTSCHAQMLKHGRAGVPLEVMGLMLGEFVDEYTVKVVDVFAMPQSGTGVSVEAVDPVFQAKMLDMLKQTGRPEMVVGWYHSHPGFGCWLSGVDINTQQRCDGRRGAVPWALPVCVPGTYASALLLSAASSSSRRAPWRWSWTPSSRSRARW